MRLELINIRAIPIAIVTAKTVCVTPPCVPFVNVVHSPGVECIDLVDHTLRKLRNEPDYYHGALGHSIALLLTLIDDDRATQLMVVNQDIGIERIVRAIRRILEKCRPRQKSLTIMFKDSQFMMSIAVRHGA